MVGVVTFSYVLYCVLKDSIIEAGYRKQKYGMRKKDVTVKEDSLLHRINWHRIVLDEAHNIKERSCNTARSAVSSLPRLCDRFLLLVSCFLFCLGCYVTTSIDKPFFWCISLRCCLIGSGRCLAPPCRTALESFTLSFASCKPIPLGKVAVVLAHT